MALRRRWVCLVPAGSAAAVMTLLNGLSATSLPRQRLPQALWQVAARRLDALDQAEMLEDLRVPPGNRLERLRGDRRGQHSIQINDQYRICFQWTEAGPVDVEVVDDH